MRQNKLDFAPGVFLFQNQLPVHLPISALNADYINTRLLSGKADAAALACVAYFTFDHLALHVIYFNLRIFCNSANCKVSFGWVWMQSNVI